MELPAKVEMDLFSLGLIIGCFLDKNRHPKLSPRCYRDLAAQPRLQIPRDSNTLRSLFPNNSHLDSIRCDRLPFLRPAVCQLCSSLPHDRGDLGRLLDDLNSQSRTRLQSQLVEERAWWRSNSEQLKSLFERSLETLEGQMKQTQSSSMLAMGSTVESALNEVLKSLTTNMANQSQEICEGIEEVLACVKRGQGGGAGEGGNEEVWKKLMEVKRRMDAI
jgi:hypothetical protein